jgi:hypothetical protein
MIMLCDFLQPTASRVEANTCDHVNERIARETRERLAAYRNASHDAINARLLELDREWDIERVLETNAGMAGLTGAVLALTVHRKFAWISAFVGGFLVMHALQGWCPPVPILRRAGVRTAREINEERIALMKLRGDFSEPREEPPI